MKCVSPLEVCKYRCLAGSLSTSEYLKMVQIVFPCILHGLKCSIFGAFSIEIVVFGALDPRTFHNHVMSGASWASYVGQLHARHTLTKIIEAIHSSVSRTLTHTACHGAAIASTANTQPCQIEKLTDLKKCGGRQLRWLLSIEQLGSSPSSQQTHVADESKKVSPTFAHLLFNPIIAHLLLLFTPTIAHLLFTPTIAHLLLLFTPTISHLLFTAQAMNLSRRLSRRTFS